MAIRAHSLCRVDSTACIETSSEAQHKDGFCKSSVRALMIVAFSVGAAFICLCQFQFINPAYRVFFIVFGLLDL